MLPKCSFGAMRRHFFESLCTVLTRWAVQTERPATHFVDCDESLYRSSTRQM